jgi:fermentation-respiration switch protein FrsA (DUF1100 family)
MSAALDAATGKRWFRPRNLLLIVVAVLSCAYLGNLALLFFLQDKMIFPASRDIYRDPSHYAWAFEEVWLEPTAGERTHAWWIPMENARGVCLFSHGNAGNMADRLESIGTLRTLGLSVLAYDYGGYGKSSGTPSEARLYDDIGAAWRYLVEQRKIAPRDIILFGRSLGGAPTAQLASEVAPAGVVLESTFTSLPAAAQEALPFFPARWLVRHHFDTVSKLGKFQAPLMVVHSPDDNTIRYHHGEEIFAAAREPKQFLKIHGSHNAGFVQSQDIYLEGWKNFLDTALKPSPAPVP